MTVENTTRITTTKEKHLVSDCTSLLIVDSMGISTPIKRSSTEFMVWNHDQGHHRFMIGNSI